MPPNMTQDDQSHLRLLAERHIKEAGKCLVAFVEADLTKLDDLSEIEKHAITLANPVALRRFEGRLTQQLRSQAEERRRKRPTQPYPTMLAQGDW
jgi:hypothetical protein